MSSYPPTPQRKSCNCEDPCISTDDVYYAGPNLPNSGINTYNVLTSVIEKLDAIYAVPTLQKVTEAGNLTTLPIIADSFAKIGGDGSNILLDDGTVLPIGDLPASVTETSQLINDGEDGINPFITALDIPAFNPSDYDLDEFTNLNVDPFAKISDIPAAPGLQEVLGQGNSFTNNQMSAYDPVSDTNTYIRPYGFTFQRDYDLTEYTYNGVHFTTMGSPDVRSNMLNPKRETVGEAIYIFPEKPSGTYTLATSDDIPAAPYKVYTAIINQVGTNAPTTIVLENTLGGTVVWTYNSIGNYTGTLSNSGFTENKTVVFTTRGVSGSVVGNFFASRGSTSTISITTSAVDATPAAVLVNNALNNSQIEIRVYN